MQTITILHTNDFHGKLTKRAEEIILNERRVSKTSLLLDSGDAISSGNIYFNPFGEPILKQMSRLGYDAMAMGNREFHFLEKGLESKLKLAEFPVLCANISGSDISQYVYPYIKLKIDALRITIFGLTVPMITDKMFSHRFSPFVFHDPIMTAVEIVPKLRADCDLLIALTHIGVKKDCILAESVPGINIISGGHSHTNLVEPLNVKGTYILQAGWWGHVLGKAQFEITDNELKLIKSEHIDLQRLDN
jgi:2',3'-cyclic-nucleotide 2'-phosphodiesterase (5'-nucleotidase family)